MIGRLRNPPSQKALPLPDWPRADREAWDAAQVTGNILDDHDGIISHLNAQTRDDLTRRYAYFLFFLARQDRLERDGAVAASVTAENILDYVRSLGPRVSSVTLAQSLYKISRVAGCLDPGQDWGWLRRFCKRIDLRAKPRDRRSDVVEIKDLFRLGRRLMYQADKADLSTALSRALLYRDGLIIALLSTDPLRSANITALEIGRTLIKDGTTWSLSIPAEETKAGRPHFAVLPDWSTPCIDRYVDHYRPLFRNAEAITRLWLSRIGRPLDDSSLYRAVCKRTREAFGKPINPHLFRSCFATSTAVHHGANLGLAMTVLGHQDSKITTRHYNQAKMIDAVRAYQEVLLAEPEDQEQ